MKRFLHFALGLAAVLGLLILCCALNASGAPLEGEDPLHLAQPRGSARTLVVTSASDSGPGTLRQVLTDAQSGDTITFDPSVFPPMRPVTIALTSGLPEITQGNLTLDASDAGVILDGGHVGTTPETLLLDDVSLRLDGGSNLIVNGDFSAGLGHWRPSDEAGGATRSLNRNDFHSSPNSYFWSTVAQVGEGLLVYDTANISTPFEYWSSGLFYPGSTVWITATGNSAVELRFWYRGEGFDATLVGLFPDGHVEDIGNWSYEHKDAWTEAVAQLSLPANVTGVGLR